MVNKLVRIGVLLAAGVGCLSAGTIGSIVVYGDSLSDNGNLYAEFHLPPPPYYDGRFSNGPVAVEQMAATLHVPLIDFAVGGATTGIGDEGDGGTPTSFGVLGLPGLTTEYESSLSKAAIASQAANGLFIVWGGPNDFLSPSPSDTTPQAIVNRAVGDLAGIVQGLRAQGVTNILVPGMPDLGLTPSFLSKGPVASAQATALTNLFNQTLVSELPAGTKYFDTANFLRTVVNNPGTYGLSNVTDACFGTFSLCSDPNSYLFFDADHPTTYADSLLASNLIAAVVPEPCTLLLIPGGLLLFAGLRRRRKSL